MHLKIRLLLFIFFFLFCACSSCQLALFQWCRPSGELNNKSSRRVHGDLHTLTETITEWLTDGLSDGTTDNEPRIRRRSGLFGKKEKESRRSQQRNTTKISKDLSDVVPCDLFEDRVGKEEGNYTCPRNRFVRFSVSFSTLYGINWRHKSFQSFVQSLVFQLFELINNAKEEHHKEQQKENRRNNINRRSIIIQNIIEKMLPWEEITWRIKRGSGFKDVQQYKDPQQKLVGICLFRTYYKN